MITKEEAMKLSALLFNAGDVFHIAHLTAKGEGSYARHSALGDLYDAVRSGADEITEMLYSYIGVYSFVIPVSEQREAVSFARFLRARMVDSQKLLSSMPDVLNKWQEIMGIVSRGIYKLENLK